MEYVKFDCPECSSSLKIPRTKCGQTGRCPRCNKNITVPETPSASAAGEAAPAAAQKAESTEASAAAKQEAEGKETAPPLIHETESLWYVAIKGKQSGPYDSAKVLELLKSGSINPDSKIWRKGLDNWQPLRSVEEFASAIPDEEQAAVDTGALKGEQSKAEPAKGRSAEKVGFFRSLFDFSFTHFVMMRVLPVFYALAILISFLSFVLVALAAIIPGVSHESTIVTVSSIAFGLVFGLIVGGLMLLSYRLLYEIIAVLFRLAENTRKISENTAKIALKNPSERQSQHDQTPNAHR